MSINSKVMSEARRLRSEGIRVITLHRDDFAAATETCPHSGDTIINNPFDNMLELAGVPEKQRRQISAFKMTFTAIDYELPAERQ